MTALPEGARLAAPMASRRVQVAVQVVPPVSAVEVTVKTNPPAWAVEAMASKERAAMRASRGRSDLFSGSMGVSLSWASAEGSEPC